MKRIIYVLLLTTIFSCNAQDERKSETDVLTNQQLAPLDSLSEISTVRTCKKCDKKIIEMVTEKYNKITLAQLEEFFCSLGKSCVMTEKYKDSGATYGEVAFEMFIVELDLHLNDCVAFIDKNKDIDFNYLLSLLTNSVGNDLPYPSIEDKLNKKKSLTPTEQKILDAIKQSKLNWNKTHKDKVE